MRDEVKMRTHAGRQGREGREARDGGDVTVERREERSLRGREVAFWADALDRWVEVMMWRCGYG